MARTSKPSSGRRLRLGQLCGVMLLQPDIAVYRFSTKVSRTELYVISAPITTSTRSEEPDDPSVIRAAFAFYGTASGRHVQESEVAFTRRNCIKGLMLKLRRDCVDGRRTPQSTASPTTDGFNVFLCKVPHLPALAPPATYAQRVANQPLVLVWTPGEKQTAEEEEDEAFRQYYRELLNEANDPRLPVEWPVSSYFANDTRYELPVRRWTPEEKATCEREAKAFRDIHGELLKAEVIFEGKEVFKARLKAGLDMTGEGGIMWNVDFFVWAYKRYTEFLKEWRFAKVPSPEAYAEALLHECIEKKRGMSFFWPLDRLEGDEVIRI